MAKGYYYDKRRDNYVARAYKDGRKIYLGAYISESSAKEAYNEWLETGYEPVVATYTVSFEFTEQPTWWQKVAAKIRLKKLEKQMDKHLNKVKKS